MRTKLLYVLAGMGLLAALSTGCAPAAPGLHGSPYSEAPLAPQLDLVDTSGKRFDMTGMQGRIVFLYFGYTKCPDECPLTLANAAWMAERLGADAERLAVILVTVDPANDTPAVLRAYLDQFNAQFIGLTGTEAQLAQARQAYGVVAEITGADPEHTQVIHGTRVYLIDPDGKLVTSYDLSVPKEDMLSDVRAILDR